MIEPWVRCSSEDCPCPNHTLPSYSVGEPDGFMEDPTFYNLTHSNDAPLASEHIALSSMVDDFQSRIAVLETSEEHLKAHRLACEVQFEAIGLQLAAIDAERARISRAMQQRKDVLSPVRRLPAEILQQIFRETFEFPPADWGSDWDMYQFEKDDMLWSSQLICKRWQSAMLNDPFFWSFFVIVASNSSFDDRSISRLAIQMRRAQNSPTISVYIRGPSKSPLDQLPKEIAVLLLPLADRIQELYLFLPLTAIPGLSLWRNHLKSLTSLVYFNSFPADVQDAITVFEQCPRLRTLKTIDIIGIPFVIPWGNVERILSRLLPQGRPFLFPPDTRPSDWRTPLANAPKLVRAFLELDQVDLLPFSFNILTCHSLVSLTIVCHGQWDSSHPQAQLLSQLLLPSLKYLTILDEELNKADLFTIVVDFVERSQCLLITFGFHMGQIIHEDLIRLLRLSSRLVELVLNWIGSPSAPVNLIDVFRALDFPTETARKFRSPRLCSLDLTGFLLLDGQGFLDMVRKRRTICPFQVILLGWQPSQAVPLESVEGEMAIIEDGLKEFSNEGLRFVGRVLVEDKIT